MINLWKCPPEIWESYTERQKAVWNEMRKAFAVTDYLPSGLHMGKGHAGITAAKIATRVVDGLGRAGVSLE